MIERVAMKIILGMELEANQYSGYWRMAAIGGAVLMVVLWLSTFMIVWYQIERAGELKNRVRVGAKWTLGAFAAYLLFSVVMFVSVGSWPLF
ncbi:MAG: hypothetical protein ACOYI5_11760 [Christensenellales bacterium]